MKQTPQENREEELNKILLKNPDFVFYDWEKEEIGKDLADFIQSKIEQAVNRKRKIIKLLITDEIAICHREKEKTSRLTSLFNKLST